MPSQPEVPKFTYGDAYSIGQLGQMWRKPTTFVRSLLDQDLLNRDERGLVTNVELGR